MFRFAFLRKLGVRCTSIERREVFGRIVINHIRAVKNRWLHQPRTLRPK